MAINQKLNTIIEIGGALSSTMIGATNKARKQIGGIGSALTSVKRKQNQIERFDIKGLRDTRNKLKDVKSRITDLSIAIDKSKDHTKSAGLAYRRASDKVNELARSMKGAEDPTGALAHELEQAQREAVKLEREFKSAKRETSGLEAQMQGARTESGKLNRTFDEQRKSSREARDALREQGIDTRKLADETKKLERRASLLSKMQTGIGRVGSSYSNMTHQIGSQARTLSIGLGIVGGGLFAVANSTSELGDKAAKTADKLGLQIGALQELRYAAERSGVSSNTLDMAMQRMVRRLAEAKEGGGAAKDAIEELGLSAEALASMTPDEALNEIANAMQGVESQSDKVRLAFKFFDSEGVSMVNMLKDGSTGLKQLRKDAQATGYVLSNQASRDAEAFQDALLDAKLGMSGFKNTIGTAIMPVITTMMGDMSQWFRENRDQVIEFSGKLASGLRDAVPVIGNIVKGLTSTATTIIGVTETIAGMVGGYENLGVIVGGIFAAKTVASVVSFGSSLVGVAITIGKFAALANPIGLTVAAIAGIGTALYTAYNNVEWFRDAVDSAIDYIGNSITKGIGFFTSMPEKIGGVFDGVKSIFSDLVGFVVSIPEKIGGAIDSIISKFSSVKEIGSTIGSFFGFGNGKSENAKSRNQATRSKNAVDSVKTTQSQALQKTENQYAITNNITVNQQPGQDARQLAVEIERILKQKMRGSLTDQQIGAY